MVKIYLANGLFSQADRDFNVNLAAYLNEYNQDIKFYLPQMNGEINDKQNVTPTAKQIFDSDNKELDSSDYVLAILDGVEIDSGVACEIGRAKALGKTVLGLVTDIRYGLPQDGLYRNLYVLGAVDKLFTNTNDLGKYLEEVEDYIF